MTNFHPIQTRGLKLELGGAPVLRGVDWTVPEGTATGLIGRNGAGKSTLLHTVLGLLIPSEGECLTLGQDARRLDDDRLAQIGFVDQQYQLLSWMTVESQIRFVAMMRPGWDLDLERRLLDEFDLRPDRGEKVADLSGGARQRLAVLVALCHRPRLILLDEPVSSQDPIFRGVVLQALRDRMMEDGATVVLSSHVLRDIESIVDRITMLNNGRIGANEDLDVLKDKHQLWIVTGERVDRPIVARMPYVVHSARLGSEFHIWVRAGDEERRSFEREHGVHVEVRRLSLEDLFPLMLEPRRNGELEVA
ncbi:ABC transporter ATP-binding protein YtrB [Planctomycetes bacterium Poly30]|uniref:ABC transporter ATP-binding protein YtrB n=1 Tax=Saltatorellus ferox TaxID=2528018 RepID=A0A518ENL6_9BACT|nr:ABC transporter ATP-binding protein YtrB [Planctomycetes bacterium Poly30]